MNKLLIERVIRRFIIDSSPCVPFVSVNSTPLDNASSQAPHHDQHRNPIVVRLLAEGSVVVVLMAIGWWGMAHLGSSTLASQSDPLTAEQDTIYVGGCPVPDPLEKGSVEGGAGEGGGCSTEGASRPITSRRPGAELGEHAHGAERHGDDKAPSQAFEN